MLEILVPGTQLGSTEYLCHYQRTDLLESYWHDYLGGKCWYEANSWPGHSLQPSFQ